MPPVSPPTDRLTRVMGRALGVVSRVACPPVRLAQRHFARVRLGVPPSAQPDALRTAGALAALHLPAAARDLLRAVLAVRDTPLIRLRLAELLLSLGDEGGARDQLDGVDAAKLSPTEAQRHALTLVDLTNLAEGGEAALAALDRIARSGPDDPRIAERRLQLLALADPTGVRFFPQAEQALMRAHTDPLRRLFIEVCIDRNQGPRALPLLASWLRREPGAAFALEKSLVIAWQMQDEAWLNRLVDQTLAQRAFDPALLTFAVERIGALPAFRLLRDGAERQVVGRHRNVWMGALSWARQVRLAQTEGILGAPGPGVARLDRVLRRYPFLPLPRLLRARLSMQQGIPATNDLDLVLRDAPQLPEPYALRFAGLNALPGTEAAMADLLDRRAAYVPRFRQAALAARPVGVRGPASLPALPATYDIERFQLNLRRGRSDDALAVRAARPPNRALADLLPGRYTGFAPPVLEPGARIDRLGVIGWDGVADEIRWAQTYGLLPDLAEDTLVSCEPRLLTLLQRSFPRLTFVAVPRRWTHLWGPFPVARHGIPEQALSAAVDEALLDRLAGYDRIVFADEITFHLMRRQPELLAAHRARLTKGYLRPDPGLLARQQDWLQNLSGGLPCVGLLWRSQVQYGPRNAHYLDLDDLLPLVTQGHARFVALQARMTPAERDTCAAAGIAMPEGVDLHDDFEAVAALTAALDLVTGISSLPYELAAAVGTPVWLAAVSPQGVYQRRGTNPDPRDQLTLNGHLILPQAPATDRRSASADVIGQIADRLRPRG